MVVNSARPWGSGYPSIVVAAAFALLCLTAAPWRSDDSSNANLWQLTDQVSDSDSADVGSLGVVAIVALIVTALAFSASHARAAHATLAGVGYVTVIAVAVGLGNMYDVGAGSYLSLVVAAVIAVLATVRLFVLE